MILCYNKYRKEPRPFATPEKPRAFGLRRLAVALPTYTSAQSIPSAVFTPGTIAKSNRIRTYNRLAHKSFRMRTSRNPGRGGGAPATTNYLPPSGEEEPNWLPFNLYRKRISSRFRSLQGNKQRYCSGGTRPGGY